ncbi:MAG TPA: beta-propeller domain-containing protein, partial [Candidatus Bathyarchaeia archaeon]|nr:beta-propeller domain-containing protein [Candidatus Bathyarchaeia archaeon]
MLLRKAAIAYILVMSSLALIPISVVLTTPIAHAMVPFTSYRDIQEFVHANACSSPPPVSYERGGLPVPTTASYGAQSSGALSLSPNHSETNQQVSGVDELDTVKSDGQYIYTITNNTVAIVQAYPSTDAKLVSRVTVTGVIQGLFVVANKLVIVSETFGDPYPYYTSSAKILTSDTGAPQLVGITTIYPIQFSGPTSVSVFDISNHANPVITAKVEVNGTLAGARLIGSDVYVVTSQPVYCYPKLLLPEEIVNGRVISAVPSQVYHSDVVDQAYSFTTVLGFDTTQSNPNPTAKIYLIGTTSTIYVSLHDIYLTQSVWSQSQQTIVHRISIDGLAIDYKATGAVPGHILNQFSMDEYNGYLRIATSNCCPQVPGTVALSYSVRQQETNVYVLDQSL